MIISALESFPTSLSTIHVCMICVHEHACSSCGASLGAFDSVSLTKINELFLS